MLRVGAPLGPYEILAPHAAQRQGSGRSSPAAAAAVWRCGGNGYQDARWQTARDVANELEWVSRRGDAVARETPAAPDIQSIVVLPFENLSSDPDQAYFSDGVTEELIADLARVRGLRVISRTSAMLLKGSKKDLPTITRDLNVRYVLEGSVRRAGNSLRITARLIEAATNAHL